MRIFVRESAQIRGANLEDITAPYNLKNVRMYRCESLHNAENEYFPKEKYPDVPSLQPGTD